MSYVRALSAWSRLSSEYCILRLQSKHPMYGLGDLRKWFLTAAPVRVKR